MTSPTSQTASTDPTWRSNDLLEHERGTLSAVSLAGVSVVEIVRQHRRERATRSEPVKRLTRLLGVFPSLGRLNRGKCFETLADRFSLVVEPGRGESSRKECEGVGGRRPDATVLVVERLEEKRSAYRRSDGTENRGESLAL